MCRECEVVQWWKVWGVPYPACAIHFKPKYKGLVAQSAEASDLKSESSGFKSQLVHEPVGLDYCIEDNQYIDTPIEHFKLKGNNYVFPTRIERKLVHKL